MSTFELVPALSQASLAEKTAAPSVLEIVFQACGALAHVSVHSSAWSNLVKQHANDIDSWMCKPTEPMTTFPNG